MCYSKSVAQISNNWCKLSRWNAFNLEPSKFRLLNKHQKTNLASWVLKLKFSWYIVIFISFVVFHFFYSIKHIYVSIMNLNRTIFSTTLKKYILIVNSWSLDPPVRKYPIKIILHSNCEMWRCPIVLIKLENLPFKIGGTFHEWVEVAEKIARSEILSSTKKR